MLLVLLSLPPISCSELTYQELIFGNGSSYNKNEAPYTKPGIFVSVLLNPTYVVLVKFEEDNQLVSFMAIFNYTWRDPRLAFDPQKIYEKTEFAVIPASLIWKPYIYCYNCIEVSYVQKNTADDDVFITSDGTVSAFMRARFDTVCTCDIGAFPFDVQYCGINFEGGFTTLEQLNFFPVRVLETEDVIGTPEWEMEFYNATNEGESYIFTIFTYKLKRNSEFYFYFMILPTLVITSTCLAALLLPSNLAYGEKITMGVTGLLGLTFLLSILVQEVPRSKNLPLIGKWLLIEMFVCILAMGIISPMNRLKKRISEKGSQWTCIADILLFLLIFGANFLTTLLMCLFPGELQTAPKKFF